MKIKNIKNNRTDTVTYKQWKKEYIDTGLYVDYEITDYFSVVELHRLHKDGTRTLTFMEKQTAKDNIIRFKNEFEIKDLSFDGYNKWLIKEGNKKGQSLLERLWLSLLAIVMPKDKPKKKAEPIKRSELINFIGVFVAVIMLLLYVIVVWKTISVFFIELYNKSTD